MDFIKLTADVMIKLYEFVVATEECKCILYIPELEFYRIWLKRFFCVQLNDKEDDTNVSQQGLNVKQPNSDQQDIKMLSQFMQLVEAHPFILNLYDLYFYKQWVFKNGGKLPPEALIDNQKTVVDYDLFNFQFDFEIEGKEELPECQLELANKKKDEALTAEAAGNYELAIVLLTEALCINPCSANLYAKRAKIYLASGCPVKAINDSTKSIYLNPDFAPAYKCRGNAYQLLAIYECAYNDLTKCCQLDYDEDAFIAYKCIEPMAAKLADFRRQVERAIEEDKFASTLEMIRLSKQLKEQQVNEQKCKEQQVSEQHGKEQQVSEQQCEEQQVSEQQCEEQQVSEQQCKEKQAKKQLCKEQQAKEIHCEEQHVNDEQGKEQQLNDEQGKEQQPIKERLEEQHT